MLVGRTLTGKSTVKALLIDPTTIPPNFSLASDTKDPLLESLYLNDCQMMLNIIDTPGLFQTCRRGVDARDNETILRTIGSYINHEINKLHVICFCMPIACGLNLDDINSIKLLIDFFGPEASRNSCLIVTHCESKNGSQRTRLIAELHDSVYLKEIIRYFELGVHLRVHFTTMIT